MFRDLGSSLALVVVLASPAAFPSALRAARDPAPGFAQQSVDLPGMPAAVIPADMDGDGRQDLVVLVAYTGWGETAETERVSFDDIEGLVEVMNVVTALVDHRELRVYRALEGGGYAPEATSLELDTSVHALQPGPATEPLLAITDQGVAAVRLVERGEGPELVLEPLVKAATLFAGTGSFFSEFEFLVDLDRDGVGDLLLPTAEGWSVYRGASAGFEPEPSARIARFVPPPEDPVEADAGGEAGDPETPVAADEDLEERDDEDGADRAAGPPRPVQPAATDLDGDGRPDLLVFGGGQEPVAYRNLGGLAFAEPVELSLGDEAPDGEEIAHVGPLDGSGAAWVVSQTEVELPEDAGARKEIDNAKRPVFIYAQHALGSDLRIDPQPTRRWQAVGYTFEGNDAPDEESDIRLPGGFQDLDGDGRQDLVAITLDFSIVPLILQVLVTHRLSLTMDFHPWCQQEDGSFREVPGLDLSGRFKINLRNVQVKHLSQFAGDFDGDGRADFVQLGRGRKVTIHYGGAGCTYPAEPSRTIRLAREPKHLGLVRILDLDADGRSDLFVVQPLKDPKSGESIPSRLDLYLSE